MINPDIIPGDNFQFSVDDILYLLGRTASSLELEQRKNLALRTAYVSLREEFKKLKESLSTTTDAPSGPQPGEVVYLTEEEIKNLKPRPRKK